jgi:D-aminopeptidase
LEPAVEEKPVAIDKARARDLGLQFHGTPGPFNAITDVPGVEVGFTTLRSGGGAGGAPQICTGVTAVLPRGHQPSACPVWAGQFSFNGNGEMTGSHWVHDAGYFHGPVCLTNTHSVGIVHHAAVGWMIEAYPAELRDAHGWAMPVVAETYDGMTNDINGRHITEQHARAALINARSGPVAEGNVGGGTGMQTYEFKGGTGTSSRRIAIAGQEHTVGVLVQSNFGTRPELKILGTPVGRHLIDNAIYSADELPESGSIIVLIATDAPLSPTQLRRLAKRGALGLARTGTSGGHYSGDLMLAFSTANPTYLPPLGAPQPHGFAGVWLNDAHCDAVYAATVDAVEEAIINALIAAESVPTIKPPGRVLAALDHRQLLEVMRAYGPPEALRAH